MANRYWVGGSGSWTAANTANWSASSGGASGASVPSTGDHAYFDANSGSGTVTLGYVPSVLSLRMSNFLGVFDFSTNYVNLVTASSTSVAMGTNVAFLGSKTLRCSYVGTALRFITVTGLSAANALNIDVVSGSGDLDLSGSVNSLNFTGSTVNLLNRSLNVYGSLTLSTGMTLAAGSNVLTFGASNATVTHTFNSKTLDFPVTFNAAGSTQILSDALTVGATRALTLRAGTIQFKSGATSSAGTFVISGSSSVTLNATTSGSAATISQTAGTVGAINATIKDIAATGGATWNAFVENNNINGGNNTGWDFGQGPIYDIEFSAALRSFTERKHF